MIGGPRFAAVVPLLVASGCGPLHVRAVSPGSSGPLYACDANRCVPAQTDDPRRKNLGRMDYYELPAGCVALARATVRRDGPTLDVLCGEGEAQASYRCERGTPCRPLAVFPPPRPNDFEIDLPPECGGRVHELVIVDATKPGAVAYVECDASSGPIEEM